MPEFKTLDFSEGWKSLEREPVRQQLEESALPAYLAKQRWFASKGSEIKSAELRSRFVLSNSTSDWLLAICRVDLANGLTEDYFVPLAVAWDERPQNLLPEELSHVLACVRKGDQTGVLKEAQADPGFIATLVRSANVEKKLSSPDGSVLFSHTKAYFPLEDEDEQNIKNLGAEQSNTSILIAKKMILKLYRKLERGIQPELEMGRYLTNVAAYKNTPPQLGSVEQFDNQGQPAALAVIQGFVPNKGDGWSFTLNHLKAFFSAFLEDAQEDSTNHAYSTLVERLGARIAELHHAFAIESGDPAFQPEPIQAEDVTAWKQQIRTEAITTFGLLTNSENMLPPDQRGRVRTLLEQRQRILDLVSAFSLEPGTILKKTRFHGDLHLGQVLVAGDDFYIIDFEGEPARPFAQRRAKHSPLRDLAGMLRSLNYAAWSALFEAGAGEPDKLAALEKPAIAWEKASSDALMEGYQKTIASCSSCPTNPAVFTQMLNLFILEKALYEVRYELANRPSWLQIPVEGIMRILGRSQSE